MSILGLASVLAMPALIFAQDETAPAPTKAAEESYSQVIAKLYSKQSLAEFIFKVDHLVDAIEENGGGTVMHAETRFGLSMDATIQKTKEATLYYFSLSRGGAELHYSDAVKLIALYTDRCGLPHPSNVTSGEHDIYYTQWLFKPSDLKKVKKFMTEARARSRAQKDPIEAFAVAVQTELNARAAAKSAE